MLGAIQKLGEPCQSPFNAGFLTHLYAIATEDVIYIYPPSAESVDQPLSAVGIDTNAVITEFLIRPKIASFSETSLETPDGSAYNMQLSLTMKGSAVNIVNWKHQIGCKRFILLFRDVLGNCYLAGNRDNGARVSWSRQVGPASTHSLTFSLVHWHPILFLPTIDLELLFPMREFDYSFDLSFS